jgi:serine/threonine protein kinase
MMKSDDNEYTTGGDTTLSHTREIGGGGSGVVHEVNEPRAITADMKMLDVYHGHVIFTRPILALILMKAFARKLIQIPLVEPKILQNEIKVLTELCQQGAHAHIVAVLRIGEIRHSRVLFIDMELCDLNLHEYIYCTKPRETVPIFFIKDHSPPTKARQIWTVMLQIVKGVEYLHGHGIIHRDVKPVNSDSLTLIEC